MSIKIKGVDRERVDTFSKESTDTVGRDFFDIMVRKRTPVWESTPALDYQDHLSFITCIPLLETGGMIMAVEKMREENTQKVRAQSTAHVQKVKKDIPPLKHGARLTRDEFERRYDTMPYIKKAELIEGVVYMPSPVRFDVHSEPHAHIITWLGVYCAATPGIRLGDNATVRLGDDNEPQPDALLRLDEALGGNSRISDDGYIEGATELIVEIAATSADYDLREKLETYRCHGVREYIVWRTEEGQLDWFRLVEGEYVLMAPDANSIIESQIFYGLRLAVKALLEGSLATVLSELQKGLETAEHAAFVEQLNKLMVM